MCRPHSRQEGGVVKNWLLGTTEPWSGKTGRNTELPRASQGCVLHANPQLPLSHLNYMLYSYQEQPVQQHEEFSCLVLHE